MVRILVVDDDHDTADGITLLLRLGKHDARACYSGMQCLAMLKDFRPDAIFLDLGMPDVSGYDVAAQVQGIVLIALTGYGQERDIRQTQEAGFACHLLKPVTHEQLLQAVAFVVPVAAD